MGVLGWRDLFDFFFIIVFQIATQSHELHPTSSLLPDLPRLHLITYVDTQYEDVVRDGLFVNRLYANAHSYHFTVLNGSDNKAFSLLSFNDSFQNVERLPRIGMETDPRWEKVAVVLNLMQQYREHPHSYPTYICWFDADLIFLNFSTALHDFIDAYVAFDMIISAEFHAETGVANTGLFLIRCSTWSLSFLQSWWDQDHTIGHDQILFDRLYKSLWPGIDEHVKVLPANKLNTIPPAYNTLQSSEFVLHLMGEQNDYRQQVFRYARQLIEDCLSDHDLQSINLYQLGINQSYLANSFYYLTTTHTNTIIDLFRSNDAQQLSIDGIIDKAEEFRELMLQQLKVMQSPSFNKHSHTTSKFSSRMLKHHAMYDNLKQIWQSANNSNYSSVQVIKLLNLLGMFANDLLQETQQSNTAHDHNLRLYEEAESWLQMLLARVDDTSQTAVYAMLAMLYENKALYLSSHHQLNSKYDSMIITLYQRALQIYDDFIPLDVNKYQYALLTQNYAEELAQHTHDHSRVNYYYHISCQFWEMLLYAESTWKEDHNHYVRLLLHASELTLPEGQRKEEWNDKFEVLYSKFPNEVGDVLEKQHMFMIRHDGIATARKKFRRRTKKRSAAEL